MKAMWSGAITFGLVKVEVKAFTATQNHGPELHHVHAKDSGRVSMRWVCKDCGEEVPFGSLSKGHDVGTENEPNMVVLAKHELSELVEKSREMEIIEFVEPDEIDPTMYDSVYFLAPQGPDKRKSRSSKPAPHTAPKGYALLREALRRTKLVAIARVTLRTRQSIAMLRVVDDVIVMHTLRWADEVRAPEFEDYDDGRIPAAEVTEVELASAEQLVSLMRGKFDPANYVDSYCEGLERLIADKAEEHTDNVIDLVARLNESVPA
jgi:DNA end-binding protein Ku